MRVALDTNVLAYAEGVNGIERRDVAIDLIGRLPAGSIVLPVQVLGELFNVLVRKAGRTRVQAREALLRWSDTFPALETSPEVMAIAVDLAADHQMGIWDSVVLAAAAKARCRLLLSGDLQDGFTWHGVTVANPFAADRHTLLRAITE
ncbi:putative nucleic acid-binding protein [Stella humosa]|uniref:Putative nucleic acid-binding protein n=1 Tax=Stella humosa TaxID=94 RepID=A0A3N1KXP8_9PROT|nr:PIN domain-containing protein [Stella humosa]ROP83360.1 putative nucleic acid-binding protein [Stella humosa]BBK29856.1 twitching motility protein PilT [Stella humosa]